MTNLAYGRACKVFLMDAAAANKGRKKSIFCQLASHAQPTAGRADKKSQKLNSFKL